MDINKNKIIIFLGPPGSGKGTQSELIANKLGFKKISTGDILRDAIRKKEPLGEKAYKFISKGELVPDDIMINLVVEKLNSLGNNTGVILDGFPRTLTQAEKLDSLISIDKIIYIFLDEKIIIERLTERRICVKCNALFHLKYMRPQKDGICDSCGGELIQRDDDKIETVKERLNVYRRETEPIVNYYIKNHPDKIIKVDGNNSIENINQNIINILQW